MHAAEDKPNCLNKGIRNAWEKEFKGMTNNLYDINYPKRENYG